MRTTKMICRLQQIDDCRSAETTLSCSWATIHWKPPQPYARAAHHENHGERSALDVVAGRAVRPIFGGQMSILSEFLHNYAPSNGWGTFFTAAFGSLDLPATPQVALEKRIFEKTLIRGRALAALVALVGAIDGLSLSTKARNEMVENRRTAKWSDQERLEFFLGLRTAAGVI